MRPPLSKWVSVVAFKCICKEIDCASIQCDLVVKSVPVNTQWETLNTTTITVWFSMRDVCVYVQEWTWLGYWRWTGNEVALSHRLWISFGNPLPRRGTLDLFKFVRPAIQSPLSKSPPITARLGRDWLIRQHHLHFRPAQDLVYISGSVRLLPQNHIQIILSNTFSKTECSLHEIILYVQTNILFF